MTLSCHHMLPCGHILQHSAGDDGPFTTARLLRHAMTLSLWLESRIAGHDCALVSPENPAGYKAQETAHG